MIKIFSPLEQFYFKFSLYEHNSYISSFIFGNTVFIYSIIIFFFIMFFFIKKNYLNFFLKIYVFNLILIFSNISKDFLVLKKKHFILYYLISFLVILNCNLIGIFPYSFALTSHIFFTFFLSLSFFYGLLIIAFRFKNVYFFSIFYPAGVPLFIVPLLVIIEIVSFFSRVFSLAIRLFANIMSGHILIKILSHFGLALFFAGFYNFFVFFAFLFCFLIIVAVFTLEIGVAFIQSYVFVLLKLIYMKEIVH